MNKQSFVLGVLFIAIVAFTGSASADANVDYIISPDTLMLNSKAPYFAVEIMNTSSEYDIRDIDPDSVNILIDTPQGSTNLGTLTSVKPNPEINQEYDKLVLMYYRDELYSGQVDGMSVLEYLADASSSGTGQVDFEITGKLYDGTPFKGDAFTVDLLQNQRGGDKGGGPKK